MSMNSNPEEGSLHPAGTRLGRGDAGTRAMTEASDAFGARSRRRWSTSEKRAIVAESYDPNVSVSSVARKHRVSSVSLYHWRKKYPLNALSILDEAKARLALKDAGLDAPEAGNAEAATGESLPAWMDPNQRVALLTAQVARLQAELNASKTHRRFLIEIVKTISEQLRLLAEVEDVTDVRTVLERSLPRRPQG